MCVYCGEMFTIVLVLNFTRTCGSHQFLLSVPFSRCLFDVAEYRSLYCFPVLRMPPRINISIQGDLDEQDHVTYTECYTDIADLCKRDNLGVKVDVECHNVWYGAQEQQSGEQKGHDSELLLVFCLALATLSSGMDMLSHTWASQSFGLLHKFTERLEKKNVRDSEEKSYNRGMKVQIYPKVDVCWDFRELQGTKDGKVDEESEDEDEDPFLGE